MLSKRSALMIIEISMGLETCLILGQVSHDLLYSTKKLLTDICGPGGDWRENSLHPGQIIYGQNSGNQWESTQSWSKSGLMKSSILKTHENCEESLSSTPRIRNSKKPTRTRVTSWKHQWLLLCHCKLMRNCGRCASKEADESTRMRKGNSIPHHHEDHIAGKGENSLQHYNLVHKFLPMPQAM